METPRELAFGLEMAVQTAKIKLGEKWTVDNFAPNDKLVAEALLIGYATIVWPRWMRDFDLVAVEKECPKLLAPWLTYNSRPDTIVRRKSDGTLWYGPEDKTTAWVDSLLNYQKNIQLHATALCVEDVLGEPVAGALVQGLYKGFEKQGQLYHPLCYAYSKEGIPGVVPDQWSTKWVRGWERTPTNVYPGGLAAWIAKQPDEVIAECFPMSPPITLNRPLAQKYLQQVAAREKAIHDWREAGGGVSPGDPMIDVLFPQHFNQCDAFSKGRRECGFKPLCFNPTTARFPLQLYKRRVPHHDNELTALSTGVNASTNS